MGGKPPLSHVGLVRLSFSSRNRTSGNWLQFETLSSSLFFLILFWSCFPPRFFLLRVCDVEGVRVVGHEGGVLEKARGGLGHLGGERFVKLTWTVKYGEMDPYLHLLFPLHDGLVHPGGLDVGGYALDHSLKRKPRMKYTLYLLSYSCTHVSEAPPLRGEVVDRVSRYPHH